MHVDDAVHVCIIKKKKNKSTVNMEFLQGGINKGKQF